MPVYCFSKDLKVNKQQQHEEANKKVINHVMDKQIGGVHYQNKIQPWSIIDSWGLNFYEGNILKYLLRRKNNRVEDLRKLIHYAEKLIELESGN